MGLLRRQVASSTQNPSCSFGTGIKIGAVLGGIVATLIGMYTHRLEKSQTAVSPSVHDSNQRSSLSSSSAVLRRAEQVRASGDIFGATELLLLGLEKIETGDHNQTAQIELLIALSDRLAELKQHDKAVKHRHKVLAILRQQPGSTNTAELVLAVVALATDLYLDLRHDEALTVLAEVGPQLTTIPAAAARVLHMLHSTIYECKGDFPAALYSFETALKVAPANTFEEVKQHIDLLKRTRLSSPEAPTEIKTMMEREEKRLVKFLLEKGPWESEWQLPKKVIPGLLARPWHILNVGSAVHDNAAALLESQTMALISEYRKLSAAGLLHSDSECIHDPSGGRWRRFEITGTWQRLDPMTGCSKDSPVACSLLQQLRQLGLPIIRAGYSMLEANAWLKPHFGMSNGQLKYHLGLVVPGDDSTDRKQCAFLRVGNETRGWHKGKILYFDDSFEHEVRNYCETERVVFQVAFVHPEIDLQNLGGHSEKDS